MSFGKCVECDIPFLHPRDAQSASEKGGHCYECALKSPVYNPYGYQNYEPVEVRRAKYEARIKRIKVNTNKGL